MNTIPLRTEDQVSVVIDYDRIIRESITYDGETGIFIRVFSTQRQYMGRRADCCAPDGYRRIKIADRFFSAHRVAWFLSYGTWPNAVIDHINHERSDNRLVNLRDVTPAVNSQNRHRNFSGQNRGQRDGINRKHRANKKAGLPTGVTFEQRQGKFIARIENNGRRYWLGAFETEDLAAAAYLGAAKVLSRIFEEV